MKGNRGVTLTSLIVYIIGMLIMLATLATLRTFFSKNVDTSFFFYCILRFLNIDANNSANHAS